MCSRASPSPRAGFLYSYASDRLATVTDAAGGVTEYTYDQSHRMTSIKDAKGIV